VGWDDLDQVEIKETMLVISRRIKKNLADMKVGNIRKAIGDLKCLADVLEVLYNK
jgi:hypothetical protein